MSKQLQIDDITFRENVMDISWSGSIGWGHLTVWYNPDLDQYEMDAESMSTGFVNQVLSLAKEWLFNNAKIVG